MVANQLVAAQLNIANGSSSVEIRPDIAAANQLLVPFTGFLPYHVSNASPTGQAMSAETRALIGYNTLKLTPACTP